MADTHSSVLVTGAAGLIGSAVVRGLQGRGYPVVACDNFSIGSWREQLGGVVWQVADLTNPDFPRVLNEHVPGCVVHCAAHPGGRSLQEPSQNVGTNAYGSMQIFEWCARHRVPVIYLSSSAIYGEQPPNNPIKESASLQPGTIYAVSKVACERYLHVLGEGYGLPWTVLRLFATYGSGHTPNKHQGIVNIMLTQLMASGEVVVKGSLERSRDLLYVEDAARVIVDTAFNESLRGQVFNVGTGKGTTIRDLIHKLSDLLGRSRADLQIVEESSTIGDPLYSVADITLLTEATGYRPRYPLEEGLAELVVART